MSKVICPFHNDTNPSMKVYAKFAYCFVCKVSVPVEELNNINREIKASEAKATDVKSMIKYIESLPTKLIRTLTLPFDNKGFYIVWPGKRYYKLRTNTGKNRYVGPKGIRPPLYKQEKTNATNTLVIVEGELNAMTIERLNTGKEDIVSPGAAGELLRYIPFYEGYKDIRIVVDDDAPGVVFGIELKNKLLNSKRRVMLTALKRDFNDIAQESEEALKEEYKRALGVS